MNRIFGAPRLPEPVGRFTDAEALELLLAYRRDPSDVPCPRCGPGTIEVLGFVEPVADEDGYAALTAPEGEYAAALYCHGCRRAIGIVANLVSED